MAVTPFIKPILTSDGIFYSFQSAIEDINLTFNNNANKFVFSKYALINFPTIGTPSTLATDNHVQFLAPGEVPIEQGLNQNNNINLAQSFQNYALNLEALLMSQSTYVPDQPLKVAERVFWKWMKEMGAVRWTTATSLQQSTTAAETLFAEESATNSTYAPVVRYLGEIDTLNSVRSTGNSYSQIYINVPSGVGSTPYVLFESTADTNYGPGMVITNVPTDPLNAAYLCGREFTDTQPYGLSILAFYDLFDGAVTSEISNTLTVGSLAPGRWFNGTILNSYYTDSALNGTTEVFNVPNDQLIQKTFNGSTVQYVRNTLDGVTIDWALSDYALATQNPTVKSFTDFNQYVNNYNFQFNAVLIYYDIYDPSSVTSTGSYTPLATNLYGVLFLNEVQESGLEFAIPDLTKVMPNPINGTNGNSYAFSFNLRTDNSTEAATVEKSVNDFTTFSMDLFLDVLTQFQSIQALMNSKITELEAIKQQSAAARDLLLNTTTTAQLQAQITQLQNSMTANQALLQNTNTVMQLINNLSTQFTDLVEGTTSISVSYNTDAISQGPGISTQKKGGRLQISNVNQQYNISAGSIFNLNNVINTGLKLVLVPFTNYFRHENGTLVTALQSNLNLYINDTISWQTGQVLDLSFADPVNLGSFTISIYTDANNILHQPNPYSCLVTILDATQFNSSNTGIFRIICVNASTMTFRVDKIQ